MEVELPCHIEQGPRPKTSRMGDKKDIDSKKASLYQDEIYIIHP